MNNKSPIEFLPAMMLTIAVIVLWQVIVQTGIVNGLILPAPSSVFLAFISNVDTITGHSIQTLLESVIGLTISIVIGFLTAIILDTSSWIRKAIYPILVTTQTIPMIAIAPLLLLWFGFDMLPKIIIVVLSCFFPITIATISGFAQTDPDLIRLFKSMKASYFQTLWKVKLPGSLPQFFAGVKIAATYAVTGAIVGEYVGAYQGLGIYMQEMAHAHAINVVFAIIFVIAILSVLLFWIVLLIERATIPWSSYQ